MTLTEFLNELAKTKEKGWQWNGGRPFHGPLRGTKSETSLSCPITAVCQQKTGMWYAIEAFSEAAQALAIPTKKACKIVEAADFLGAPTLRRRMMAKLGLKEKP